MAEAHSDVAFRLAVTSRGVYVSLNRAALRAVATSFIKHLNQRVHHFKHHAKNRMYPFPPSVCVAIMAVLCGLHFVYGDWSGLTSYFLYVTSKFVEAPFDQLAAVTMFCVAAILALTGIVRYTLIILLSWHGWMYEPIGRPSAKTKLWFTLVKSLVGKRPKLYSLQASLPYLPLPSVDETVKRYLRSVEPWMSEEQYEGVAKLAREFQDGPARKLQFFLTLKRLFSSNYVTDWWESYVYLYGRSPIMVNSNWYGFDTVLRDPPTHRQAARAAMIAHCYAVMGEKLRHADQKPILIQNAVPLCAWQYERLLNTVRVPGEEKDALIHHDESDHVAVYCRGRIYSVRLYDGHRLYSPAELEEAFQFIIDCNPGNVSDAERRLPALTAGDRLPWARARNQFFASGVNHDSLEAIETSQLFISLDEQAYGYDPKDQSKVNEYAKALLHGDCHSRWFDMALTAVIGSNGRFGANAEHSYADGPAVRHNWENVRLLEEELGYTADGHCAGKVERRVPQPTRLKWVIPDELGDVIKAQLDVAQRIANDVDMNVFIFQKFGKGAAKKQGVSPDAFIQLALQLAYYRDQKKFCLTYESSMTRLFREGRTETVRSCSSDSVAFVRALEDSSKPREEKIALFRKACDTHQNLYRDAMTGKGVDRHLFTMYVVSRYLQIDSPFLKEVLSEPWRLSTSQSPYSQLDPEELRKVDPDSTMLGIGGGFGPVSDDGYGVAYMIIGENMISFHISSKVSCPTTSSKRFAENIQRALQDIDKLCSKE